MITTTPTEIGRSVVHMVVGVNNQYEDAKRAQFVVRRARLWWAFGALEFGAVVLLAVSMYEHQPTNFPLPEPMNNPILGAIFVYLTGALVGLFNWAFQQFHAERSVEDYGLFRAELFLSMALSGTAAIGCVVAMVMFAGSFDPSLLQPRPEATPTVVAIPTLTAVPTPSPVPTLSAPSDTVATLSFGDMFKLARYPSAILWAIIFGFSPALLIDRLVKASTDLSRELKSTRAA